MSENVNLFKQLLVKMAGNGNATPSQPVDTGAQTTSANNLLSINSVINSVFDNSDSQAPISAVDLYNSYVDEEQQVQDYDQLENLSSSDEFALSIIQAADSGEDNEEDKQTISYDELVAELQEYGSEFDAEYIQELQDLGYTICPII